MLGWKIPRARSDSASRSDPGGTLLAPSVVTDNALILVVERDPHVKKLERFFLEQAGFAVEFADGGMQGMERARVLKPRIVITEILLPGLDGLSVCRGIRSDPAMGRVRVLVLSILSAEQRALDAGADAFLKKPLDDARLIETVNELLRKGSEDRS
jgi:DNA-binding response OmpR family regulator